MMDACIPLVGQSLSGCLMQDLLFAFLEVLHVELYDWVRAGSAIWVFAPDQTHIRSPREATYQDSACGGRAREDETILRCGV